MTTTVRHVLDALAKGPGQRSAHAGLWLDKYYWAETRAQQAAATGGDASAKATHIAKVEQKDIPEGWKAAFSTWKTQLADAQRPGGTVVRFYTLTTLGRCVLGLGAESPWENNIRLHHTWGLPVLPGSALKGLTSARAHRLGADAWRKQTSPQSPGMAKDAEPNHHSTLFGTTDDQGCVIFHDALWEPDRNSKNGLHCDVLTVHHRDYYMATGTPMPPADWDSPIPVPFLSVTGTFVLALEGPQAWVKAAAELLKGALADDGIGAKTSSGYGRMELRDATMVFSSCEQAILEDFRRIMEEGEKTNNVRLNELFPMIGKAGTLSEEGKTKLCQDIRRKFHARNVRQRADNLCQSVMSSVP